MNRFLKNIVLIGLLSIGQLFAFYTNAYGHQRVNFGMKRKNLTEELAIAKENLYQLVDQEKGDSIPVAGTISNYLIPNVPMVQQRPELPTGCEITCITMMLQYAGFQVDKSQLAVEMPYHANDPYKGFVGDPFKKSGWTIYPSALKGVIFRHTQSFVDLTGRSNSELEQHIQKNRPIAVWGKFIGFNLHCMLLVGYDENNYYFNDPWTGRASWALDRETFQKQWEALGRKAVSY